jgi:hypothetical protein
MAKLLVYVDPPFLSSADERALRKLLGSSYVPEIVPFEFSVPSSEHDAVHEALSGVLSKHRYMIVVAADDVGLSRDDAVHAVAAHCATQNIDFEGAEIVRELDLRRCWAFLVNFPGWSLPSGLGFIVDKASRTVLQRRFIDLAGLWGDVFDEDVPAV